MSAEAMPKRETGVYLREGSTQYQLRVKAPKGLTHLYPPSGIAWRGSLGTSDLRVANSLALAKRAELAGVFAQQLRELQAEAVGRITPELAQALAQAVAARILGHDERLRADPATAQAALAPLEQLRREPLKALTIGGVVAPLPEAFTRPVGPFEGLPGSVAELLANLNQQANIESAVALASQNLSAVLPLAQAEARRLGFTFDKSTPGALEALRECLKSYRKARDGVSARDRGEVVETPEAQPQPEETARAKGMTLRGVFAPWKAAGGRGRDGERACELAVELFEQWAGPAVPIHSITRAMGHELKGWLLAAAAGRHVVTWEWVKGHAGNAGNEAADRLANLGAARAMVQSRV